MDEPEQEEQPEENESKTDGCAAQLLKFLVPVAAGMTTVMALKLAVMSLGFGTGGISAWSLAARMMSLAARTGYGMPVVSCLQSVGAAGMTLAQSVTVGTTTTGVTSGFQAAVGRRLGKGGAQGNTVGVPGDAMDEQESQPEPASVEEAKRGENESVGAAGMTLSEGVTVGTSGTGVTSGFQAGVCRLLKSARL